MKMFFLPQFHMTECKIDCFVGDHGSKWVAFAVGKVGFMDTTCSPPPISALEPCSGGTCSLLPLQFLYPLMFRWLGESSKPLNRKVIVDSPGKVKWIFLFYLFILYVIELIANNVDYI